ncbi:ABC transporter substrate-binding protein [Pseudactinotalea sp. HY160]|uniref:iron-siderophore ABC transporter substrate-binding protein n=1 Tax=Pseudactinotalea sp. HY160 TaxID=2654490 RepID=UPI00128BA44C|nr:iron-siderophore ABC transporter substrate-binding protein [Pseudactinotalea sp. HY160]MPV50727.1 ABC transporter substrate-binding protein [Pseudactinotalea sp. HY160]
MIRRPRILVALAAAALALTACSSGGTGEEPASPTGTDGPTNTGGAANTEGAPTTIEHAFGETVVPADPHSVVTLGWGSADAAIAVGVVPTAMESQPYGGDENGVLPWIQEELTDLGAATPVMLPVSAEEPAYEEIAAASPDLILAVYSGITAEQYELLSQIAPTVAYPDEAWSTPWRQVVEIVGEALGRTTEAATVLADIDDTLERAAADHPEFAGKTIAATWDVSGTFYVYKPADPRVGFLRDLGFVDAPAVTELANGDETFYYTLSHERLSELDSDVLVSYADTPEQEEAFLAAPYAATIPAVTSGAVASITGPELVAAVSPPTALSLTWGLDSYLEALSAAAKAA